MKGFTPLLVWIISNKANNPLTLAFILRLSFNIYWWFFIIGDMTKPKIIINIKPAFCIIPTLNP